MCTHKSDYGNIVIDITDGTQPDNTAHQNNVLIRVLKFRMKGKNFFLLN